MFSNPQVFKQQHPDDLQVLTRQPHLLQFSHLLSTLGLHDVTDGGAVHHHLEQHVLNILLGQDDHLVHETFH